MLKRASLPGALYRMSYGVRVDDSHPLRMRPGPQMEQRTPKTTIAGTIEIENSIESMVAMCCL